MSTPENIVKFNEVTGITLAHLYEKFPVKTSFLLSTLFPDTQIISAENTGIPQVNLNSIFVSSAIDWLIETGYITGQIDPRQAKNLVLTSKGLELLKLIPNSIDGSSSFGDELVKATKTGTKEVLVNVASSLLTSGISVLYNTIK
ncbi:hypothetical protein [Providencia sp. PROV150]|uniref:hypothetical protein n=1 Tax=Providencia sp. PROV150 TaxID=2949860 RepID=UPI00234BEB87|nr:hypothetical protein [Providencia sp. PROV150]